MSDITQAELAAWIALLREEVETIRQEFRDSATRIQADFEATLERNRVTYKEYVQKVIDENREINIENEKRYLRSEAASDVRLKLQIEANERNMTMLAAATLMPHNAGRDRVNAVAIAKQLGEDVS